MATTSLSNEDSLESELLDSLRPDIEKWIDESKLSVMNITYGRSSENVDSPMPFYRTQSKNSPETNQNVEYSNMAIGTITGDTSESIKGDKSITEQLDKLVLSETSSERSFTQNTDDKIPDIIYQVLI